MFPIYLNNRDRLNMPRQLAEQCARLHGVGDIIIIDNASTYPPLLDWYETCPYKVIKLKENVGPQAMWRVGPPNVPFVYTDSDLDIGCVPKHVLFMLKEGLDSYPQIVKIGLSLEIEDIPDAYPLKKLVLERELPMWEPWLGGRINDRRFYKAAIDTTFAMYRAGSDWVGYSDSLRTIRPYTARHLPWYIVEEDEEETYYLKHLSPQGIFWSALANEKYR